MTSKLQSQVIRNKYPDTIPIIIKKHSVPMKKYKYIVPSEVSVSTFLLKLREYLLEKISSHDALFLFTENGTLINGNVMMHVIDKQHRNENDGFLYLTFQKENVFGN